jgi:PleD family two-component response regulator
MTASQRENCDKGVSPELGMQKLSEQTVAAQDASSPNESTLVSESKVPQFRYRVLVVDDEPSIRKTAGLILEREGYEVPP